MDKSAHYRRIVGETLLPFAVINYANRVLFDDEHNCYLAVSDGWRAGSVRFHGCVMDLEIINGKIRLQDDNTAYGVATDLESLGVPKSDIVLGFHLPEVRPHTEYAAA